MKRNYFKLFHNLIKKNVHEHLNWSAKIKSVQKCSYEFVFMFVLTQKIVGA